MRFQYLVWADILSHLFDLSVAFLLALPIGWHQEKEARSAGVRTFSLVAVTSCGFVLVAIRVLGEQSQSQARILEGIIVRVGFICGGAILKTGVSVQGTAAAASIWSTGVIGAAVGFALYDIALVHSLQLPDTSSTSTAETRVNKGGVERSGAPSSSGRLLGKKSPNPAERYA